uniref:Uncharacterized protein n=1 Tax=Clastoptera arizonana TaxID=38151 RepID=A0A1B6DDR0_9HEMI
MSSEHDKAVLNSIFNPYLPLGENAFESDLISVNSIVEGEDEEENNENIEALKKLEIEGIIKSEAGDIESAITLFTEAINTAPSRASCYNNRAQGYRLQGKEKEALNDLNTAIELSAGKNISASQALCQRGLVFLKQGLEKEATMDFKAAAAMAYQNESLCSHV